MAQQTVSHCVQHVTNVLNSASILQKKKYVKFPQNLTERNLIKRQFLSQTQKFMMTPIDNAADDFPEGRYNYKQKCARSTIEHTFGIFKGRWRCLLAARELHYAPVTAGKIVIACCVLHNMYNRAGLEALPLSEEDLQTERNRQGAASTSTAMSSHQAHQQGQRARDTLVQLLERNRT